MPNKIKHKVPLSQLRYENTGMAVPRGRVDLFIPYDKIPLKTVTGCMLEHMAGNFKADLSILLRITPETGAIEGIDVEQESQGLKELNDAIACLKDFKRLIQPKILEGSLTLQTAREVLTDLNHQMTPDDCLNKLLAQIVAEYPPQKSSKEFDIPLEKLRYSRNGISFSYNRTHHRIPKEKLKGLTPRPCFNRIRKQMAGKAVIERYEETIYHWDINSTSLKVGNSIKVSGRIRLEDKKVFDKLCYAAICETFNGYKLRSPKHLEQLVTRWGISLKDEKAGRAIVSGLAPLVETSQVYPLALKDVRFGSKNIRVTLDGKERVISPEKFNFKTRRIFNRLKHELKVFTNEIRVLCAIRTNYRWLKQKPHYQFGLTKFEVQGVDLNQNVKEQLSNIYELHIAKKAPPTTTIHPISKKNGGIPKKLTNKYIQALEGMAEEIFFAQGGYWFHVKKVNASKDRLIWEVRTDRLATFIFDWPGENRLDDILQQIVNTYRRKIYKKRLFGFVDRVVHPHGKLNMWKKNVKQTL